MEVLIFLALVVILVILISSNNALGSKFEDLKQIMLLMNQEIHALKKKLEQYKLEPIETPDTKKETIPEEKPKEIIEDVSKPVSKPENWWQETPVPQPKKEPVEERVWESSYKVEPVKEAPYVKPPSPPQKPGFFERNPDLEKFIGENLINKIGIAVLVLGIAFFVKFAIDKQWINEIGRVFIGLACGGILLGIAHKLRNHYKAFSSVLIGGGMAVFYFTIAIAFRTYGLFDQTTAFIIMIIITVFTVLLSILYDRIEIAALAIIGGFITPFLVSQGEGSYIVLFTYLSVLNIGMLVLAYYKNWSLINLFCYVFTIILYGSWLFGVTMDGTVPIAGALIYATLFYLIFFLMNIINNIKENRKFLEFHIGMLISNTFLYFWAGMSILGDFQEGAYRGLFTALIALFNFVFAYTLYKNKKVDLNLAFLLIGLTLTFISLAAPIQLKGNHITLFWAAEAVLLLWLSQKSGIKLMKLAYFIIMGLMILSLIMDWNQIYIEQNVQLTIIINKAFITGVVFLISVLLSIYLLKNEGEELLSSFDTKDYKNFLQWAFVAFLYAGMLLELTHQLPHYVDNYFFRQIIVGSYNLLFIIGCFIAAQKRPSENLKIAATLLAILGIMVYIIYYHGLTIIIRDSYLTYGNVTFSAFLYHYILVALAVVLIVMTFRSVRAISGLDSSTGKAFLWFSAFLVMFIASSELDHIIVLNAYNSEYGIHLALLDSHKIGYPILWGIGSFALMILGMKHKMKTLRVISLTLFFVTLFKLFLFDIRGISEGGKIAAFISLGVLLLIVSFMYQKLKALIIEGEVKKTTES